MLAAYAVHAALVCDLVAGPEQAERQWAPTAGAIALLAPRSPFFPFSAEQATARSVPFPIEKHLVLPPIPFLQHYFCTVYTQGFGTLPALTQLIPRAPANTPSFPSTARGPMAWSAKQRRAKRGMIEGLAPLTSQGWYPIPRSPLLVSFLDDNIQGNS